MYQFSKTRLIATDQKGQGILHFVQGIDNHLEIYDFISNSRIWLYMTTAVLARPVSLWHNASGILVDGLNQTMPVPASASSTTQMRNFITVNVQMG